MAFTVSKVPTTFGHLRAVIMSCTADSATEEIETGLGHVVAAVISPISMTTALYQAWNNIGTAATASPGAVSVTGVASGDEFQLIAIGT